MIIPRYIRFRDAPDYCGMCRATFNREIRPKLVEIPIDKQGVAFDRLDLDEALDEYKARNGRPPKSGGDAWLRKPQAFSKGAKSGTSTSGIAESQFAEALIRATSARQKQS